MFIPQSDYTRIAFESIKFNFLDKKRETLIIEGISDLLYKESRGCFVSVHMNNDDLRGCIGTIEPQQKNIVEEIKRNAVSAAFHDHRFSPLTEDDLQNIKLSVDVLTLPERVYSYDDLDPSIYGLIISDGNYQKGVLLPSLPGIETIDSQIEIVKRKAGLSKADDSDLMYYRFTSTRYH